MRGVLRACVPSIEECIQIVRELREEGIPKDKILVITNVAGKEAIIRNVDLRGKSGRVISAHRLARDSAGILHLQEYADLQGEQPGYQAELDPIREYWQDIEDGSIGIFVITEG